jgi:hypothetical protein
MYDTATLRPVSCAQSIDHIQTITLTRGTPSGSTHHAPFIHPLRYLSTGAFPRSTLPVDTLPTKLSTFWIQTCLTLTTNLAEHIHRQQMHIFSTQKRHPRETHIQKHITSSRNPTALTDVMPILPAAKLAMVHTLAHLAHPCHSLWDSPRTFASQTTNHINRKKPGENQVLKESAERYAAYLPNMRKLYHCQETSCR